jgi:hypothetical protein
MTRLSCAVVAAASALSDLADVYADGSRDVNCHSVKPNLIVADNSSPHGPGDEQKVANKEDANGQTVPRNVLPLTAAIWQHGARIVHEGIPQWCCATCLISFLMCIWFRKELANES